MKLVLGTDFASQSASYRAARTRAALRKERMKNERTIYIAGSSKDLDRVKKAAKLAGDSGWGITHRWWDVVEHVGDANPKEATRAQQLEWSLQDLNGVETAHAIWLLADVHGLGCWIEFGFSLTRGQQKLRAMSGKGITTIFASLAGIVCETDEEALKYLNGCWDVLKRQGA